jgi:hypothetical protein
VVETHAKVSRALVNVDAGDVNVLAASETASTIKMTLINVEKISSVNRVKYLTQFDPDVMAEIKSMPEAHSPVHAYKGRNGLFVVKQQKLNIGRSKGVRCLMLDKLVSSLH